MVVFTNTLLKNIVEFVEFLRLLGVRTSISESLDAVRMMDYIDPLDRDGFKAALSACLAKSEEERRIFSTAFDIYFVQPEYKQDIIRQKMEQRMQKQQEVMQEAAQLQFKERPIHIADELKEVYADLPPEEKQNIQDYLQRTSVGKNVKEDFRSIVENMVSSKLKRLSDKHGGQEAAGAGSFFELPSPEELLAGEVQENLQQENRLMHRSLKDLTGEEVPQMINLIRQITDKLRRKASRKFQHSVKKSRLDFKKTFQSNLNTGGLQFHLKYINRRRKKDRLLILCDVSASMYLFSGFVLQFLLGMDVRATTADSFIFAEEVEHIQPRAFGSALDFEEHIKASPVWKKGTNIYAMLQEILSNRTLRMNSSTLVFIVSDAKTVQGEKTAESLALMHAKVKDIFWLNPIEENGWKNIPNLEDFRKSCTMLDCSTLEKLARACARVLRVG